MAEGEYRVLKGKSKKILIVDDERQMRDFLSVLLSSKGFDVITAENGEMAFKKLLKASYDLLITDLNMPIMNGLELVDKMYQNDIRITTIIMSAFLPRMSKEYTERRKIYGCIAKPFQPDEIITAVEIGLMAN
ncbi:MAG: response regulator [Thermodesulfobacteriota bacterium]|nr:response regulator [Thermodesulfobacteriota bacterium]